MCENAHMFMCLHLSLSLSPSVSLSLWDRCFPQMFPLTFQPPV